MEQDLLKEKIKDMLASYEGKNYKKAESLALDISEKLPEQTLSLKILTMIYIYFNQIQKAFEISKKVIHLDPKDAETTIIFTACIQLLPSRILKCPTNILMK